MTAAIRTQGLTRRFGGMVALDGIDLEVPPGAIYTLVGPNGAGKTTLIKVLMNIIGATSGTASVLGTDSRKLGGKSFARIGYVSENQELPDWMTAGGMLAYFRNFYPEWDRELERQLVRQFDLPLNRKLKHMSRGMRMKASLASSLAYRPALIVLDEPFSGLDPLVRDELIEGLLERAPETTIFLSSHDLAEIEAFSSHIGFLDQGRLLFSEEMTALTDRFREVTVTLDGPPAVPAGSWLQYEAVDSVLRFVHSEYDRERAPEELAAAFPAARNIIVNPMSLRSIFLAIARSKNSHSASAVVAAQEKEIQA